MPDFGSRHRLHRLASLHERVAALAHELDTIPDRKSPMPQPLVQRGWRVIDDVRDALRLAPVSGADRGNMPFDLVWQVLLISGPLNDLKALSGKATPRSKQKSYARRSARPLQ